MGAWMDQQLRLGDSFVLKSSDSDATENHLILNGEDGTVSDNELHPELNSEHSDAATLEQRRAYKIELQVEY
jgi:brefeldin A-inhibited guanine nucleotide-exchange protein